MANEFSVSATQSRPAGLPLFVLGRNNLNPRVVASADALHVKVVTTSALRWRDISKVSRKDGLRSAILSITCGGWEYLLHFRDPGERDRLQALLAQRRR